MTLSASFSRAAHDFRYWFVGLVLLFVFSYGPDVYLRATNGMPPLPNGEHYLTDSGNGEGAYDGRPLGFWWATAALFGSHAPASRELFINMFRVDARNLGNQEIILKEAYMISDITGQRIDVVVTNAPGGQSLKISEIAPVPPSTVFELQAPIQKREADFLEDWGAFTLVVKYDDKEVRHGFDKAAISRLLEAYHPEAVPHITKRVQP